LSSLLTAIAMLPTTLVRATDGTLPFAVQAPFMTTAPVADGAIASGEYAFSLTISFAGGTNPGEIHPGLTTGWGDADADNTTDGGRRSRCLRQRTEGRSDVPRSRSGSPGQWRLNTATATTAAQLFGLYGS